jgi:ferredoxin-NADP reductase
MPGVLGQDSLHFGTAGAGGWPLVATIAGAVIVGLIALQALVAIGASTRRAGHARRVRERELELLDQRIAAARVVRAEREQDALAWDGYRKFEVERKVDEGGDICSLHLVPHDRKRLPGFRPGQYLTFRLSIPGEDRPTIRCYSLSDAPLPDHYRVSVKRVGPPRDHPDLPPGRSSTYFHDAVEEGDILDVKAPSGQFYLDLTDDAPIVLIGGGVGITPVLSMLNAVVAHGAGRETWFFYGVRNATEHVMAEHLRDVAAEHPNVRLQVCYSDPGPSDRAGVDYDHAERVSIDLFKRTLPSSNYHYLMCGPPPMMESLTRDLAAWGVPREHVHLEAFGPASVKKTKAPAPAPAEDVATGHEITFSRSGVTVAWKPSCDSLLEFAEENGVMIDSGCRAGSCGTCLTAIKSGEVEYTTKPDADAEEGSCLTCVCVPKGALDLDA